LYILTWNTSTIIYVTLDASTGLNWDKGFMRLIGEGPLSEVV